MIKPKKAFSKFQIIPIIIFIVIVIMIFSFMTSFSKKVSTTEKSASADKCEILGTTNYCCEQYSPSEIIAKGAWSDCKEPLSACCVG